MSSLGPEPRPVLVSPTLQDDSCVDYTTFSHAVALKMVGHQGLSPCTFCLKGSGVASFSLCPVGGGPIRTRTGTTSG